MLFRSIVLRSRPGETFTGKVARIEQLSDAVTEERIAMVTFDSLPAGLTLNEMAEVTLHVPARPSALAVPPAALVRQDAAVVFSWQSMARRSSCRSGPVCVRQAASKCSKVCVAARQSSSPVPARLPTATGYA
mgnify:CR=1 FL=1